MRRNPNFISFPSLPPQEEEHDPLVHSLQRLYDQAMVMPPDANPDPNLFLPPFLEVIRNEYTSGQVTGMALSAINKFLAYGVIGMYFM